MRSIGCRRALRVRLVVGFGRRGVRGRYAPRIRCAGLLPASTPEVYLEAFITCGLTLHRGRYALAAAPAAASDRFTGLPVYPGAANEAPVTISKTCGGTYHVRTSAFIWSAAASDSPARIAAWDQQALPGARLAHLDVTFNHFSTSL
jgi:hypothetical protein